MTSCGIAPSTGNVWTVMPQLRVVSNEEWGQSKACFPLAQGMGRALGVVRDGSLVAVDLESGKAAAVPGDYNPISNRSPD